jgi:hypothetical protein
MLVERDRSGKRKEGNFWSYRLFVFLFPLTLVLPRRPLLQGFRVDRSAALCQGGGNLRLETSRADLGGWWEELGSYSLDSLISAEGTHWVYHQRP